MGREDLEPLKNGVLKRKTRRQVGVFVDGTGLDRATRRLERKVELAKLVQSLSSGLKIEIACFYSLIPFEDDARQVAYLDAVGRAGFEVVTKRLPPKNVSRHVDLDVMIASDMLRFAYGAFSPDASLKEGDSTSPAPALKRCLTLVCPSRELSYAVYQCNQLGVETTLADFGTFSQMEGWKGIDKWIDLASSETIWR